MKPFFVPLGRLADLKSRPDANLLLIKPPEGIFGDFKVIPFKSRLALEEFNKRAKLRPVIYTTVPKNCAIHAHQKETE